VNRRGVHRWRTLAVVAAIGGAALFVWTIRTAGTGAVLDGIRRLGVGFVLIVLLGGLRFLFRAAAWQLSVEPPEHLTLRQAFAAVLAGDALGNVTPFGFLASEPSKVLLVSRSIGLKASISALTVETLFYAASVALLLVLGTAALLFSFDVHGALRAASVGTLGGALALSAAAIWVLATEQRVMSRLVEWFIRWNLARSYFEMRRPHVLEIEDRVFGFVGRRPERVYPIVALELAYHAAAVAEIWIAIALISGRAPSLLMAFVLEYVNRAITIAFQFVPMWLGVDEAGTGIVARTLELGTAAGVSLALVRKARIVVWTALGLVLLARQGMSLTGTDDRAGMVTADR
jgi:hypothetical protein